MTTTQINRELDNIEYEMKHFTFNSDNNGNTTENKSFNNLQERHDNLMEMLNTSNHE